MARILTVFFLSLLFECATVDARVTPVAKVVSLLKKLHAQITEEGKVEAAQYANYSTFCRMTKDDKNHYIDKSANKIEGLDAKITELNGEISALNTRISELGQLIQTKSDDISNATAVRQAEHEVYLADNKNLTDALSQIDRAIEALKASKVSMGGKVQLEAAALSQVKAVARSALVVGASSSAAKLQAFVSQPGQAYESTYHSNKIIQTLEELKVIFTNEKKELDQVEFDTNAAYESRKLGLENEQKFAEKEKTEKEALEAAKTEEMNKASEDRAQEDKEMNWDKEFLQALIDDCAKKAAHWEQRSQTRGDELAALANATETLETGVVPNWAANKKLAELQSSKTGFAGAKEAVGHWQWVQDAPVKPVAVSPSFLQLRGSKRLRDSSVITQQALVSLMSAASKYGSPVLAAAVLKVKASEDHFVKVRQLIKDLVARLEQEARDEATTKSYCDTSMKTQVSARDAAKAELEKLDAELTGAVADQAQLEAEIAALSSAVADNEAMLKKTTEMRLAESAENNKTVEEAVAGKAAVDLAIQILSQFYHSQGVFLQRGQYEPWKAANSTRTGETVRDLAPEVFDEDYHGKQQESKGIIGLLEVIQSDFDRTEQTVTAEETEAQLDFDELESDTNQDTDEKNSAIKSKSLEVEEIKGDIVSLTDDKNTQQEALALADEELEKLKKMCVDGEETYAERVAKREEEIASLKEALRIIDTWQG